MKIRHFNLAKKLSQKSNHRFQIGAVVTNKKSVLGIGFNNARKTHTKSTTDFNTIHAELSAILSTRREMLDGCDIYIFRALADGSLANSYPCRHCLTLIRSVGIKTIYFTKAGKYARG